MTQAAQTVEQISSPKPDRYFLGGSDIAVLMNLSRWKSALQLWGELTGKLKPKDLSNIEAVEIGVELEEYVARKFMRKTGYKLRRDQRDFVHHEYEYMQAHIDRWIVGEDALFEAKTTSARMEKEWQGEEIPQEYVLQCNWYCGILGKSKAYIAVLIGGQKFVWKVIDFHKELFDKQVAAAKHFWDYNVLGGNPPLAVSGDEQTLAELFKDVSEDVLRLGEEDERGERLNSLAEERQGGVEQKKLIEEELSRIDNQIKQIVGEHETAMTGQYVVTWKQQSRTDVDKERLKADDLFEQYAKTTSFRVLRTKQIKGEPK